IGRLEEDGRISIVGDDRSKYVGDSRSMARAALSSQSAGGDAGASGANVVTRKHGATPATHEDDEHKANQPVVEVAIEKERLTMESKDITKNTFSRGDSRFNVLYEERDDEMQESSQPSGAMHIGLQSIVPDQPSMRSPLKKGPEYAGPKDQVSD
ncbi:hypothetical protein S245_011982, partial [Arachis hypogaea]